MIKKERVMTDENEAKHTVNKFKIYAIASLIFILGNFIFETVVALIESQQQTLLYPILPFTRIYLLIVTILAANYFIRRRQGKPKQKLWWQIIKGVIMFVLAWFFFFLAWLSVSETELERMRQDRPELPVLQAPVQTEINVNNETE